MSRRVLVVDDDADMAMAVAFIVETMDFDVTQSTRGQEALDLLKTVHFDLVISDLAMPGVDGFSLIEQMRARDDRTPVLFLSGTGTVPGVVKLMKLGAVGFIEKPFEPQDLKRQVAEVLAKSAQTSRPPAADELDIEIPITVPSSKAPTKLGRYDLRGMVASGGMGRVYRAHDPELDRTVAIKVLRAPETMQEELQFLPRFRREAVALAKLDHPNIVRVFDFGLDEPTNVPFVVMELLEGESLAKVLDREKRLPLDRTMNIVVQVAEALAFAHAAGMVHRDVKPDNVFLEAGDVVRLIDFGIARTEDSSLTREDDVLGSPSYLSPEVAFGFPLDWRADQFALCTVLLEMLSGQRVFRGDNFIQTVRNVGVLPAPSFAVLGLRDIPVELERLTLRMHAKEAAERVQDEAELLASLRAIRDRLR